MATKFNITQGNLLDNSSVIFAEFQAGSIDAFSKLYDVFSNILFNYGCKITSNHELLKDCIHDVFVKIYDKREDLSNVQNLKSYLFVSLKNRLLDEFRKNTFTVEKEVDEFYPIALENVEKDYIQKEKIDFQNKTVIRLLGMLTERQQRAIQLYYLEERSYEDICGIMDINYQSLRNLIHRGISKLREVAC